MTQAKRELWISPTRATEMYDMPRWLLEKLEANHELQSISSGSGRKKYPALMLLKSASFMCRKVAIYTPMYESNFNKLASMAIATGLEPVAHIVERIMSGSLSERSGFHEALRLKEKGEITGIVARIDTVSEPGPALLWMRALQMAHFWVIAWDPVFGDKLSVYPEPYAETIRII